MAERVDSVVNEDGARVEGDDVHARGEAGLNLVDFVFDGGDNFARVGAVADDDDSADGFLAVLRSEEHTSELQSLRHLVCRLLLEKKKNHTCLDVPCTMFMADSAKHPRVVHA